ncbi:uncharacterized protein LOC141621988 [Silene latifolia]|uniref:uncharacterized protein LOC141621988 n=1 Tax=Silene latifolia TaxID=37657 RepID=UPI003D789CBD
MEGKVIAVVVIAGLLGLVAVVLGFVGEATKIKADEVVYSREDGYCYYPKTPAMALGIVAAILLLIQQIVISVGAGCFCCSRHPCPSGCGGICSIVCFVFSWLSCIGAFMVLISAAAVNNMNYMVKNYSTKSNPCPVAKPGYYAGAAVYCLFSVTLSFISYFVLMCSRNKGARGLSNDHGIAFGQPQLPKHQQV